LGGLAFFSSFAANYLHLPLISRLLSFLSFAKIYLANLLQRPQRRRETCFVPFWCFKRMPWIRVDHLPMTPRRLVLKDFPPTRFALVRDYMDLGLGWM